MKINTLTAILIFLAIVNIVAVDTYVYYQIFHGTAREGLLLPGGGAYGGGETPDRMVTKLDKTQKKELSRIKKLFRDSTDSIYSRLVDLDDEIFALIQEDSVDQREIDRRLKESSGLRLEKSRIAVRTMIEARSLLTKEQREELYRAIYRTRPRVAAGEKQAAALVDTARVRR